MKKSYILYALATVATIGVVWLLKSQNASLQITLPTSTPSATIESTPVDTSNLKIEDTKVGTGIGAVAGKKVTVNYVGTLLDGKKFDSSYDRNTPFTFTLGAGEVIKGWDLGVEGMKVGGSRKLTIPPELGYGASGAGDSIPPDSTLVFQVDLLGVE